MRQLLRSARHRLRRDWRLARLQWSGPVLDEKRILDTLLGLALRAPGPLLVHSSLSACGRIRGDALAVIRALRSWGPGGLIAMPTHTYYYPSSNGLCRVFDVLESPSAVGAITNAFWKLPGVKRSLHPSHSLACEGPGSDAIVVGHEDCDTPCGRGTPYQRLIEQDAAVLMFGVTMNSYTFFHSAEDAAVVPYLYEPQPVVLKLRGRDRIEREMTVRRHDMSIERRFNEMDSWLEQRGLLRRCRLGLGELLFVPHAAAAHRELVEAMRRDPWLLVAESARPAARAPGDRY